MRTFVLSEGTSNKFWSIERKGTEVTVRYGRVGTAGQTQVKTFADEAKAQKEYDKLIKEKTGKGYTETTAGKAAPKGMLEALEEAVIANPDDLASHMALADWLGEQDDAGSKARGEFIRVQLALEDEARTKDLEAIQKREKELLDAHEREWLGEMAPFFQGADEEAFEALCEEHPGLADHFGDEIGEAVGFRYRFRRGWLEMVRLAYFDPALARKLAKCKLARALRELIVTRADYDNDGFRVLANAPFLANVRYFQLGPEDDQCHISGANVTSLIAAMPNLEELHLFAHGVPCKKVLALPLPHLRKLTLHHLHEYPLEVLANNATLGNLEYLSCWPHGLEPGDEKAYIQPKHFAAIVRSPHLTALKHLALYLTDIGDEGCKALVASGALKRLEVLDLHNGRITDAGARILAGCPDLTDLKRLRLSGNALTRAGVKALEDTGVALEAKGQWSADEVAEDRRHLWEGDAE